jgi:hypothetical protein
LDWTTFELGDFGFGDVNVDVPSGRNFFSKRVDLTEERGFFVDIEAGINVVTGLVSWRFTSIDPGTGDLVSDPEAGFLPPNVTAPDGEGFVNYSVRPKANLATGTRIDAQATIDFDTFDPTNAPLQTPPIFNTIDTGVPTSRAIALPATTRSTTFNLNWSGSDDPGGSQIALFDVFVSIDGGPFLPAVTGTPNTATSFVGGIDHTYAFYAVATDHVGHRELKAPLGEATTRIVAGPAWQNPTEPKDVDPNTFIVPQDVLIVINELNDPKFSDPVSRRLNTRAGTELFYFDVNGDDFVTPNDALIIINFLNSPRQVEGEAGGSLDLSATSWVHPHLDSFETGTDAAAECATPDGLVECSPAISIGGDRCPSRSKLNSLARNDISEPDGQSQMESLEDALRWEFADVLDGIADDVARLSRSA